MTKPPSLGDRFEIGSRVAVSGMSEVWLAMDQETGRQVAVKRPAPGLDPAIGRAAIDREEQALRLLDHPSIPSLISRSEIGDQPVLVLEWVDGVLMKTLRGRPVEDLLPPLIGLAEALSHAHNRGVIHRDLKAANVIIDSSGRPALIDFGIAARMDSAESPVRGGGTRGHASPQQLAGATPEAADDLYAFGALIADLLAGGDPQDSPDTLPPDGVERALWRSVQPVPAKLEDLVGRLLAPRPEGRPGNFDEVRRRLEVIRQDQREQTRPPAPAPVGPAAHVPPPVPPPPLLRVKPVVPPNNQPNVSRDQTPRTGSGAVVGVALAALVLAIGLVAVFWVLPKWVATRPEIGASEVVEVPTAPLPENKELAEGEANLRQAEEAWESLTARSVGLWAPARSRELNAQLQLSRQLVKNGSAAEANRALEDLRAGLVELNQRATTVADEAVVEARRHLEAGNADEATAAFERALLVDPDTQQASVGLKDAARLQDALRALERGGEFERSGDLAAAAAQYRVAQQKAPWFHEANRALARVQNSERETAYVRVLSQGLVALEAGDWEKAESALVQAGRLRPGAPEVEDGLLRLRSRRRLEDIEGLQSAARSFETQEAWSQAAATYSKILELAPASLTAELGKQRATERYELDHKLKGHLAHPDRLSEPAVLNDARSLVATAESVTPMGPRLAQQVDQLNGLVQRMSTPVAVELLSDGHTEVTIYRVGRLGRFEHRVVEIPPGSYTVVGARSGFRDVRLTLLVREGEKPAPLDVRCEEGL